MRGPRKVLFFAEAVTLAHVARPIALARSLHTGSYDVVVACHPRYQAFLDPEPWQTVPLQSISSAEFLRALARGSPVYNVETLRRYIVDDLALIGRIKPDLIVGDFRLSLSVSARLAGIPYATVTNAYWSPYYSIRQFPLPALPMTRFLPLPLARALFRLARPLAFSAHCKPLNRVRRENGLPSLGHDLRRIYTDADHTLYADSPAMFRIEPLPPNHHFLGPVLWSPPLTLPEWWDDLPSDKPIAYVTMGSSGPARLVRVVLDAVAEQPVTVMVSSAGILGPSRLASNVYAAEYLPGSLAAARSAIVICNGGSPTSQQALAAGVPVLGIASNMDQFLNMAAVGAAGAGMVLRADRFSHVGVRSAVRKILAAPGLGIGARKLAKAFATQDAAATFAAFAAATAG